MTKQQLINNATAKNFIVKIEENLLGNEIIAIGKNKGCYHWFDVYGENVHFNHTYSCNTGSIKKGSTQMYNVCNSLGFFN